MKGEEPLDQNIIKTDIEWCHSCVAAQKVQQLTTWADITLYLHIPPSAYYS